MNINFKIIENTYDEIYMGQKIWFSAVPGCDAVSATANTQGFTPLTAIARKFDWDLDMIEREAAACNKEDTAIIVRTVTPKLLLVPATKGRGSRKKIEYRYLKALHGLDPICLHFTHYGFLQGRFPASEISWVLNLLLGQLLPVSIKMITVDVDERRSRDFFNLMRPALKESESHVRSDF